MSTRAPDSRAPSLGLWLSEPTRSAADLAALLVAAPWLVRAPRGDGHPVLVLPGLLATDASTVLMRRLLRHLGYPVHGWSQGLNVGSTASVVAKTPAALKTLANRYSQPVSVIGWSLGGVFARRLARQAPDLVRQVITLGSPFAMTNVAQSRARIPLARYAGRHGRTRGEVPWRGGDPRPLPVPTTAIYSRSDGIVAWQTCREDADPTHESIPVYSSHLGFGHNPSVLWVLADRLAQDVEQWQPFAPPRSLRRLFPSDQATPA